MQTFEDWFEGVFGDLRKRKQNDMEREVFKIAKEACGLAWVKCKDQCEQEHITSLQAHIDDLKAKNLEINNLQKELALEKRERAVERGEMELRLNQICQTAGIH